MTTPKAAPQSTDLSTARQTLGTLLGGYRNTALIYVCAKLGIAGLLAEGPRSSDELACSAGAHAPSLHRILRGLVVLGVLSEDDEGRFSLTELGRCLQTDAPDSQHGTAILSGESSYRA